MDSRQHRLGGHFSREFKDGRFLEYEDKLVIQFFGYERSHLNQSDIDYICDFYGIPHTENWLIDGQDAYSYKVVIRKEA